jgi:hypothetical protein
MIKKLLNIFKGKKDENKSIEFQFIEFSENSFNVNLINVSEYFNGNLTFTSSPEVISNFSSFINNHKDKTGLSFWNISPKGKNKMETHIVFKVFSKLDPGIIYSPKVMEDKWGIYFDGTYFIFVNSWTKEVCVKARTKQTKNQIILTEIEGEFFEGSDGDITAKISAYLIIRFGMNEIIPFPFIYECEDNIYGLCNFLFKLVGNKVEHITVNKIYSPKTDNFLFIDSLLALAIVNNDQTEVENHLKNGLDPNSISNLGHLNMIEISLRFFQDTTILKKLIIAGARVNYRNSEGRTPLMMAAVFNIVDAVKVLIEFGADVNEIDQKGYSSLHMAVNVGNYKIVEILILNGADKELIAENKKPIDMIFQSTPNKNEIVGLFN